MAKYSFAKRKFFSVVPISCLALIAIISANFVVPRVIEFIRSRAGEKESEIWFQDSNGGQAGEFLPDFKEQFTQPEKWQQARKLIDVYQFHTYIFNDSKMGIDDAFIKEKMVPVLNQDDIKIALNVVGANWSQCGNRSRIMFKDADVIDRLRSAGGNVSYLTMQSTLSKEEGGNSEILNECAPYPNNKRIEDIVRYVRFMKGRYPGIKIGVTDADITKGKDYRTSFLDLDRELKKNDLNLDYILVDNSGAYFLRYKKSADDMKKMEEFVRNQLGLKFGLVYMSDKFTAKSNEDFYNQIISAYAQYFHAGGRPDYYLLTSWAPNPTRYLPETDTSDYPFSRILLEFGSLIKGGGDEKIPQIKGRLGRYEGGLFIGWALDESNQDATTSVEIYIDGEYGKGKLVASGLASIPRENMEERTGYVGNHGYRIPLQDKYKDTKNHQIYVYGINKNGNKVLLNNSPLKIKLE